MRPLPMHSALGALALLCCYASSARADRVEPMPRELEVIDVAEKLAAPLPLETVFEDSTGKAVRLADLVGDKPVILTFNYSNCPMLCSVQLGGLVDSMLDMSWALGREFEVITISLDPKESAERSAETKEQYLERYQRPGAADGWTFLRGSETSIKAVADAVGFGYRYHPERKEYLHPAVLTLVSPKGNVSAYVYGVHYDAEELRDKLVVAGLGDTSESFAKFILSCYHYEAPTGTAAIVAKIMRYGGIVFVLGFIATIGFFGIKRSHQNAHVHQVGSSEGHV